MADSRPPDISERVIIDLSGRISSYYDPTTYKYDYAIGGMPFIGAITDNTPYRRQTAEFRTARVDQLRDPGEQSLSGSGYWIRSQSSFHLGTNSPYQEPIVGTLDEARFRYADSVGIDPWTPGQISLLRTCNLQEASTDRSGVFSTTINGVDYLIKVTGSSTEPHRVDRIRLSDLTETTIITNSQITENILYGCMGGNDLMLVTPTKVWRYSFDASLKALPAVNFTVLAAAILMASPVFGLRPVRAARLPEPNVPKPINCTLSPLVTALMMASMDVFNTLSAEALEISASFAIFSTNSALFIIHLSTLKLGFVQMGINRLFIIRSTQLVTLRLKHKFSPASHIFKASLGFYLNKMVHSGEISH